MSLKLLQSAVSRHRQSLPLAAVVCLAVAAAGAESAAPPPSESAFPVLTNIADIWTIPTERKTEPHRMRTEVVIYYFDRDWDTAWGECNGQPTFLPIGSCPLTLKPGQRVLFDGWVAP